MKRRVTRNPSASAYLPAFRRTENDEDAVELERRAEMLAAASNRVAARVLGIHARTGLKKLRRVGTGNPPVSSADRLALIRAVALKARPTSPNETKNTDAHS